MDKLKELVEGVDTHKKILEYMIKSYEERGGGYSQKESLRTAIKAFDFLTTISEAEGLPEKECEETDDSKYHGFDCKKCRLKNDCEALIRNRAIDECENLLHKIEIAELEEKIDRFCKKEDFAGLLNTHFYRKDIADSIQAENTALKAKLDKGRIERIVKKVIENEGFDFGYSVWKKSKQDLCSIFFHEFKKKLANAIIEDK